MSWSAIEDDTRTLYSDAVKLIEGKDLELVKGQLGTRSVKKNEPLSVHSLPIHESLRLLLDRIIIDGDSEALRRAIDVHLQEHSDIVGARKQTIFWSCMLHSVGVHLCWTIW